MARGVAVFGSPGFAQDPERLRELLGRHDALATWLTAAGQDLDISAAGLRTVDALVPAWADDPAVSPSLGNSLGLFLGDVVIHEVAGAHWVVWPNGHPVIGLADGREVDVTAVGAERVSRGGPTLTAVLSAAQQSG